MAEILMEKQGQTISAGYFNKDAFRKKEKLLLVLKTGIAGMQYYVDLESEEGKALVEKLTPGTELKLFRDPDNEHDEWAVSVYTGEDKEIGYITRFKSETIARLMDYGKKFVAYIDELPDPPKDEVEWRRTRTWTENYKLPFSVYMEDD